LSHLGGAPSGASGRNNTSVRRKINSETTFWQELFEAAAAKTLWAFDRVP
jgi:hypothetical protein